MRGVFLETRMGGYVMISGGNYLGVTKSATPRGAKDRLSQIERSMGIPPMKHDPGANAAAFRYGDASRDAYARIYYETHARKMV